MTPRVIAFHIDKHGVYVNGERYDKEGISHHNHFPVAVIIIIAYLVVFVTIPLYYSLAEYFMAKSTDLRCRKQARTENAEEQMKAGDLSLQAGSGNVSLKQEE